MKQRYYQLTLATCFIIANLAIVLPGFSKNIFISPDSTKLAIKLKDNRPNRPVFNSVVSKNFVLDPYKPINKAVSSKISITKNISNLSLEQIKPIDNVKIYPNPVSNQLNLSYTLKNESVVTIKIMDVLGNEVLVLMSKKMEAGEQTNKFLIETKLSTGFYFVRLTSGSESIIKRISVL